MGYEVKVLADSITDNVRLTTLEIEFPRFILAELNTHRMFSRNSASSRAIPVEKRIEQILADPFVPEVFGANQKGMQAGEVLPIDDNNKACAAWLKAMHYAIDRAHDLKDVGVHKQWANRLLEPFAWHRAIVSATEWDNFFALRCNPDAAPEFRKIAEMMRGAMMASTPEELKPGEWHLPFFGRGDDECSMDVAVRLSVARCARVSYLTHDGKRDVSADFDLYHRLLKAGHMSPFEHAAKVGFRDPHGREVSNPQMAYGIEFIGNFRSPWIQHRKMLPHEALYLGR